MADIGVAGSLLRGLHVAALASLFGTLLFLLAVLPARPAPDALRAQDVLLRIARVSAVCSVVIGIAWLIAETALIAGMDNVAATLRTVPTVALRTQFGQCLVARLALLSLVLVITRLRRLSLVAAMLLSGAALALQPVLGHAGAIGGRAGGELTASEVLHLLAAGAWLGGLLPLLLIISIVPRDAAANACRNFTPVGLASVLLLMGTAIVQIAALVGGLPGLFGTAYGHVALIKLGSFIALLALAALNRLVLTERLTGSAQIRTMRISIALEIALGACVVITAAFLASRTPGTHEQPVWPFQWRPSLAAFDDPDLRREITIALTGVAVGIAFLALSVFWRRIRWFGLGAAAFILVWSIPHLDLLFVAAYPTSFFTSPTEFAATSIVSGERLFTTHCTVCHGAEAHGDGPAARSLPVPPADLTAEHFRAHADGDLYWFISHGFTTADGMTEMPGFTASLSSEAIWHLIDYLHAHNAGEAMRRTGHWPVPVAMPQFDAQCPKGQIADLDDFRGRALRLIAGGTAPAGDIDAVTILVVRNTLVRPLADVCVTIEPQVWTALAILLGMTPEGLDGTQVLVDPNGWLRAVWQEGNPANWRDPQVVAARLRDIAAHPLVVTTPAGHTHPR